MRALLLGCVVCLLPSVVRADSSAPLRVVVLWPRDAGEVRERANNAISAQVAELPVRLSFEQTDTLSMDEAQALPRARSVAQAQNAAAVFWTNPKELDRVFIYIAGQQEERLFVRRIDAEATSVSGRAMAMAMMVRAVVASILQAPPAPRVGAAPASAPSEPTVAPAQSPTTAAVPEKVAPVLAETTVPEKVAPELASSEPSPRLELAVALGLMTLAEDRPFVPAAKANVAVALQGPWWLSAMYRYEPTQELAAPALSAELARHPFGVQVGFRQRFGPIDASAAAGLGVDILAWRFHDVSDVYAPANTRTHVLYGPSASLAGRWWIGERWGLLTMLDVDIAVNERSYVVESAAAKHVLLAPWRPRVGLLVGVARAAW